MSLTILYRDPYCPHEGGMTMIVGQARVAAMLVHLEKRGFLIDKTTLRHLPRHSCPAPRIIAAALAKAAAAANASDSAAIEASFDP